MAARKQLIVFAYDISRNSLRARVAGVLELHGIRVQESVFESRMTARQAEALFAKLDLLLDPEDGLRMYVVPEDGRLLSRWSGGASISPSEDYIRYEHKVQDQLAGSEPRHRHLQFAPGLKHQEATVDLASLANQWHDCEITWTINGFGKAIGDPGLPGRMRGAFGDELLARASPEAVRGDPCRWDPPSAFEVLFRKQGHIEPGLYFPGPWVLELDSIGGDLLVTVRLFGFAADYASSAAEILTYALSDTVDYAGRTGHFFPRPVITDRTIKAGTEFRGYYPPNGIILDFLTPVTLTGNSVRRNPRGLMTTAAARLAGLARWHDMELEIDRDVLLLSSQLLEFEWVEAMTVEWQRGSSRQKKSFFMEGLVGRLVIAGEADDLMLATNILALGERTHIGADIAFGCGRYTLTSF